MIAAIHSVSGALQLILAIVGVLCICGAAYLGYLRNFPPAVFLAVLGLVLLVLTL